MCTVKSIMAQLTDPKIILRRVHDALRKMDPAFAQEEQQYFAAVDALEREMGHSITPSAREYIDAWEKKIAAELVYVGWLGFQCNLECFHNPANTLVLKCDYEDIHREHRMHTLPDVQAAWEIINAFHEATRNLPEEKRNLTDGITHYITYLETTGYKLAHYFGFLLADSFLGHVVPGYTADSVTTLQYARGLCEYLRLDIKLLE